jgi:hypothetical protein
MEEITDNIAFQEGVKMIRPEGISLQIPLLRIKKNQSRVFLDTFGQAKVSRPPFKMEGDIRLTFELLS